MKPATPAADEPIEHEHQTRRERRRFLHRLTIESIDMGLYDISYADLEESRSAEKADSFRESDSFQVLQADQGTSGMVDPHEIGIEGLTEDERAAFLAGRRT